MVRILTVQQAENGIGVSQLAHRMAMVARETRNVPYTLVLPDDALKELSSNEAWQELFEAYESCAIDEDADANALIIEATEPLVRVMAEGPEGIIVHQPVKGTAMLRNAVNELKGTGCVLIQKIQKSNATATIVSGDSFAITTYAGEFAPGTPGDSFLVSKDYLGIEESTIVAQERKIVFERTKIATRELGVKGQDQKINDHDVRECARIAKRIEGIVGGPVRVTMSVGAQFHVIAVESVAKTHSAKSEPEEISEKEEEHQGIFSNIRREDPLHDDAVAFLKSAVRKIEAALRTKYGTSLPLEDILVEHPEHDDVRAVLRELRETQQGANMNPDNLGDAYRILLELIPD
ncbi:MAG: hypothetical protein ABIA93_06675 [Candidatus Woesearchaeota archaeon]